MKGNNETMLHAWYLILREQVGLRALMDARLIKYFHNECSKCYTIEFWKNMTVRGIFGELKDYP